LVIWTPFLNKLSLNTIQTHSPNKVFYIWDWISFPYCFKELLYSPLAFIFCCSTLYVVFIVYFPLLSIYIWSAFYYIIIKWLDFGYFPLKPLSPPLKSPLPNKTKNFLLTVNERCEYACENDYCNEVSQDNGVNRNDEVIHDGELNHDDNIWN